MINSQNEQRLIKALNSSPSIRTILSHGDCIKLNNWYIAAGVIPTVFWNHILSNDPENYLNDIDIVYYDNNDLTELAEREAEQQLRDTFSDIEHKIDVKNQARVHQWYKDKRGNQISQYTSTEAGIDMWISVTAIGVRTEKNGYKIYAPYGLDDLFSMHVKPNRRIISAERYNKKINKWKKQWPEITVQEY